MLRNRSSTNRQYPAYDSRFTTVPASGLQDARRSSFLPFGGGPNTFQPLIPQIYLNPHPPPLLPNNFYPAPAQDNLWLTSKYTFDIDGEFPHPQFKRNLKKVEEDAFSRGYNVCLADTTRKVDEDNHAQAESSIPSTPVVPEAATGGERFL